MSLNPLNLLKVSPDAPPITDQEQINRSYRYWRPRVLTTITIGYIGFYLVRKSLAVAQPVIGEEFGIPKDQLGLILTVFGLTYGVSKFINGFAGDKTNPRYFMALGLIGSVLANFFFGLSGGIVAFGIFWILNGWFQGMGWAPCSRSLVQWFAHKERGVKFSICNTAVSIGSSLVMFLNGYLIVHYGWQSCFFVPGGIAFVIALFILWRLRDRPQSLGLPPVEQYANDEPDLGDTESGKDVTYKHLVKEYMYKNPMIWILCLGNFFVYVVRYSIFDWGTTFLTESKGIKISDAAWVIGGYEVAGIAGMLVGGWAMDKWFKGYGGRACAIYMLLCAVFMLIFWKFPVQGILPNGLLLWAIGFFIYGPQCLATVLAANLVPKNIAAASVGLVGLFGYLSTALSGWGLGKIVQEFGWNGGFLMLIIAAALGAFMFLVLWNANSHRSRTID